MDEKNNIIEINKNPTTEVADKLDNIVSTLSRRNIQRYIAWYDNIMRLQNNEK